VVIIIIAVAIAVAVAMHYICILDPGAMGRYGGYGERIWGMYEDMGVYWGYGEIFVDM
jgi:hypothetical protein